MNVQLTVKPTAAILDLATVKQHLRVTDTAEDGLIQQLIDVAQASLHGPSGLIGRALLTSTWRLTLDEFPDPTLDPITLPLPPLQAVSAINYIDANGATQLLAGSEYQVVNGGELPSCIWPAYGKYWPTTRAQPAAVTVDFIAGYTSPPLVPARARQAALLLIAHWFGNRSAVDAGGQAEIPLGVDALLAPLRPDVGGRVFG